MTADPQAPREREDRREQRRNELRGSCVVAGKFARAVRALHDQAQADGHRADYLGLGAQPQKVSAVLIAAGLFVLITVWRFAEPDPATGITFRTG